MRVSLQRFQPVPAIVGCTGSGKSAVAEQVASMRPVQLINLDPFQSYRELHIGTARPAAPADAMYRLLDQQDPDQRIDAVVYATAVHREIALAWENHKVPVLVGGSGFYLRAVAAPLDPCNISPEEREKVEAGVRADPSGAYRKLQELAPELSGRLHPSDHYRIARALLRSTCSRSAPVGNSLPLTRFGLWAQGALYESALRDRLHRMLRAGWQEEARTLAQKWGSDAPALRALGYQSLLRDAPCDEEELWRQTRRYAKRQRTWFRREPVRWFCRTASPRMLGALLQYIDGTFC